MEIKILCPCGSKYKFEVEPLGGKLPGSVQCPVCGADGTEAGNEILAQAMLEPDAASAPAASSIPQNPGTAVRVGIPKSSKPSGAGSFVPPSVPRSSRDYTGAPGTAPAPAADLVASSGSPAPGMPALPPAGSATRLSVSGGHQAPPVQAPAAPQPLPTPMRQTTAGTAGPKPPGNLRGVVGAVIGGIIGMVIWAGLIVLTETEIGWVAWGVGLLTGYSARLIGRGYSHEMGLAAALAALVAILAGRIS